MNRLHGLLAVGMIALTAGCGAARAPFRTPTNSDHFFVAGYHVYWARESWATYPFDALTELFFFEIEANADGGFLNRHGWPEEWTDLIRRAHDAGVQVTPTVSMHDAAAFEALFTNPTATDRLVVSIELLFRETTNLAGLHLDFEVFQPIKPAAREGYAAFAERIRQRLRVHDRRVTLSAFALAFDDDDAYDERALAAATDYLVVQGYDYHSAGGDRAGPTAATSGWGRLNWTTVIARFDSLGVPRRQIVLSVPLYGYEWPTETEFPGSATRGAGVALPLTAPPGVLPDLPRARERVARYGARRDSISGTPYYVFRDSSGWRQGWFEDAESLSAKYDFIRRNGLGGIALFPLAYGDEALWKGLRAAFRRPR